MAWGQRCQKRSLKTNLGGRRMSSYIFPLYLCVWKIFVSQPKQERILGRTLPVFSLGFKPAFCGIHVLHVAPTKKDLMGSPQPQLLNFGSQQELDSYKSNDTNCSLNPKKWNLLGPFWCCFTPFPHPRDIFAGGDGASAVFC